MTIRENTIADNVAAKKGVGNGGGVYFGGNAYDNQIYGNVASLDGDGFGGGVYANYTGHFDGNNVHDNTASAANGNGVGGGVYGVQFQWATRNSIQNNTAQKGGGVFLGSYAYATLRQNTIAHNDATGTNTSSDNADGGGGIASEDAHLTLDDNYITNNTSVEAGGGLFIAAGNDVLVQENEFRANDAAFGGGIAVYTATGVITVNTIISNSAVVGGGMYVWGTPHLTLDRNRVMSNTASGFWGVAGGGFAISIPDTPITITNHIFAHNGAGTGGYGAGVNCLSGYCRMMNNTFVDNNLGTYHEGLVLGDTGGGLYSHEIWNNIFVGHSTGIKVNSGASNFIVKSDFWDNTTDIDGSSDSYAIYADPQFVSRSGSDYHLLSTSPLIDSGSDGWTFHDMDGDARPHGTHLDIGADEVYPAETYVSAAVGNDSTGDGTQLAPFATISKAIAETTVGGTVYVARGTYTERISVTHSLNVLGGYRETDWARDIAVDTTIIDGNQTGTVVYIDGASTDATVEGFTITGGTGDNYGVGGGILAVDAAAVSIRRNIITGNHVSNGGAGIVSEISNIGVLSIERNTISNNTGDGLFSPRENDVSRVAQGGTDPGGGIAVYEGGQVSIRNNIIFSNTAVGGGDGIFVYGSDGSQIDILHNTVANNGSGGGIMVSRWDENVSFAIQNNIIAGFSTGITGTLQPEEANHSGFFNNTQNYGAGLTSGAGDILGDPLFADASHGDDHISGASIMAGRGISVGVTDDFDGESRPQPAGTQPDIGADEVSQRWTFLPLIMK